MEDQAIIEALLYEADEVVDGVRSDLRVELCLNAVAVFHGNGYDRVCICHNHSLLLQKVLFFSVGSIIICKEQFCKEKGDW